MMTPLLTPPQVAVVDELLDRCDGCGAAARLEVTLTGGGTLAFCGHHANRHAAGLLPVTAQIRIEDGFAWAAAAPSS
jgi:hypothetical protein